MFNLTIWLSRASAPSTPDLCSPKPLTPPRPISPTQQVSGYLPGPGLKRGGKLSPPTHVRVCFSENKF